jgi:hypothetical protein
MKKEFFSLLVQVGVVDASTLMSKNGDVCREEGICVLNVGLVGHMALNTP